MPDSILSPPSTVLTDSCGCVHDVSTGLSVTHCTDHDPRTPTLKTALQLQRLGQHLTAAADAIMTSDLRYATFAHELRLAGECAVQAAKAML